MSELATDVLEQILIGFNLKELTQLKRVCKSWYSFISSTRFHLKHVTHNNNNIVQTRIFIPNVSHPYTIQPYEVNDSFFNINMSHLLGSSNGLICISPFHTQLLVANPFTKEVRKLESLPVPYRESFCWGFGYDLVTDDYKVVVGFRKGKYETCFQIFSLKSNVWKGVGDVKYSFFGRSGILCNGAVYWLMNDKFDKQVILSFDLSKEEFKEIPQPDDKHYGCTYNICLGNIQGCVCIYPRYNLRYPVWVMKNYNGKQFWELLPYDREVKNENAYSLRNVRNYSRIKKSFFNDNLCSSMIGEYMGAHLYVKSVVSPYINGKPNRKRREKNNENNQRNVKLIMGEPSSVRVMLLNELS